MKKLFVLVMLLASVCVWGQGATVLFPPAVNQNGSFLSFAKISFCSIPATLDTLGNCTNTISVFKDQALTLPYSSAILTDGIGFFPPNAVTATSLWFTPGTYCYTLTVSSMTSPATNPCTPFSVPVTSANVALKYPSADHIIYLSPNGSDANDGLSMGAAKLTPQAAFNAATTSGTVSGTVLVAPGNYSCPTTWYSNLEVKSFGSQYPFANVTDWGFVTTQSGALFGCISGSNHTIGPDLTNIFIDGIGFNFANAGGGLIFNSVSASRFEHVSVELGGSSTQAAVEMKVNNTTGVQHNTAKNLFNDLNILANTSGVGSQANGLTLTGQGVVNTGVDVTDNWFTNLTIAGGLKNAIVFEKNTDSNYFSGVQINNTGTAQGDVIVFNSAVPGSDQDADGIMLFGVASTGAFSHPISMGQSSGNHIQIESAAEVVPNVLGGTPSYFVETIGLGGVQTIFSLNGLIRLTSSNVAGSDRIRIANGTVANPAYSFAENTDVGFYKRSGQKELEYADNGSTIMGFLANGIRMNGNLGGYLSGSGDPTATAEDVGMTRCANGTWCFGNGSQADHSGFTQSGNTIRRLTDLTLAGNTSLQTIFSWSMPTSAFNWSFHCWLKYSQATAAVADAFGIQAATNNPTRIDAGGIVYTAAAVSTSGTLTNLTTTTATNILTFTPSVITTEFNAQLDGTLQLPSNANTINIMASQSNGADLLTIKAGSYCAFQP